MNYVVTTQKPTSVTHSCVGNFTSPEERNLILAKSNRIEIHLFTPPGGLQTVLDAPIYGRITTFELFRPNGDKQDLLFIATERYKYCVLQWDSDSSGLITRAMGDVSDVGTPTDNGQIGVIDPDCRLIGLHLYMGLFKVIPLDNNGQLKEPFNTRLNAIRVLDIKFLYGCTKPTIAVLSQDFWKNKNNLVMKRFVKTYEVSLESKKLVNGPWHHDNVSDSADLLIPVRVTPYGALIIGEDEIIYRSAEGCKAIPGTRSITKAYGRVYRDDSRFLLGDLAGLIHQLIIKDNDLIIELLGKTSIASSISCLDKNVVFVGSSYGDSQLIKLNWQMDAKNPYVEILENYVNLGPIVDLCLVDVERQEKSQVVTCSGAYKDGSLRIVRNQIEINEQASVELNGIKGMWSLKSSIVEAIDTFLVVSFVGETRIFAMNISDELEETAIEGFLSEVQTLFCHDAVDNQLVQVTSNSVRLVSSTTKKLQTKWDAPAGISVNVATANASQVLLATGGGHLFYLGIGEGTLTEVKRIQLEYEVSCLDISSTGDNYSLAAVGMWTEISVRIYLLPDLTLVTKELLGGEIIPRSVLLCAFEGISYLLCALGDGHLLNFQLDTKSGGLRNREKVSLGTQPITLRTVSSKSVTGVFAASDRPAVLYSNNEKLVYINVNLKEVSHVCPFNSANFPDCLAIAREGKLTIGTVSEKLLDIRTIPVQEHVHRISHQELTGTFAICCLRNQASAEESEPHLVRLLDDQTFNFLSTYNLDAFEYGCSILSCSFKDDKNVYYCVGTAYALPDGSEPTKGRILVFIVQEKKLQLIAQKETKGAVYSLNAFSGKLLAAISQEIQLYKWMLGNDGADKLQPECVHDGHKLALCVQTRGDFIVVGTLKESISLLSYMPVEGKIEERARDDNANWMTAVEILDDDIYLGADIRFNLFTVKKNNEAVTDKEQARLEVVGEYHLGEFVNRFRHSSRVMRLPDSKTVHIPTIIFGTVNGVIGVIASMPQEQYAFLEKLQTSLRKVIKGVGGLSHEEWRSFNKKKRTGEARSFLDGDLIESFMDLTTSDMEEVSKSMNVQVEELRQRVKELTRLR